MSKVTGQKALAAAHGTRQIRRFPDKEDSRVRDGVIFPALDPSFSLAPGETVFTVGSCFARNIESKLKGFRIPTLDLQLGAEDVAGRRNSVLNEYNAGSIAQRLQWAVEGRATAGIAEGYAGDEPARYDTLLSKGLAQPQARLVEIRGMIDDIYRQLAGSDAMIVTLGMAEAWYDSQEEIWLNRIPELRDVKRGGDRYEFHVMSSAQATRMLIDAFSAVIDAGVRKIIVTVSPVPLQTTFSGRDCVTANSYSKAVMRCAADHLCRRFPGIVDYFPSYEMVLAGGIASFREDMVHPTEEVIQKVTDYMIGSYAAAGTEA